MKEIDEEILDHAEKIIKLMKLKGFVDNTNQTKTCKCINLWVHSDFIFVDYAIQDIETIKRPKNEKEEK